jgi:hypothetical protein
MCKLCEETPVYEFTNKRKLCKKCFIHYFQKKVLYTIRKFSMIHGEIIGYSKRNDLKGIVLEDILKFASEKINFSLIKLPNKKAEKIAVDSSIDTESEDIINNLINGNASNLKKDLPIEKNIIKPLYLFTDEEILLYAKIKNLNFKQERKKEDKIKNFINESEKKHPEVKRAIVNSLLELYK